MNYTVKNINGCKKKFEFNFQTIDLTKEIKAATLTKQRSSNLKGFRQGKAPIAMIEKVYGPQIESDALNSFVSNQLLTAVNSEKLNVVGYPEYENVKYEAGKSVSFEVTLEIYPEVKLKDYSSYSFTKEAAAVTSEDTEKLVKNHLESKKQIKKVEDEKAQLKKGQIAIFNFEGVKENGERPENMKGEQFDLEIGSGQFIPGFEEGMIGMTAGEKKNIPLNFPATYHVEELKNAKVTFEVELTEIKETVYPEITDDLAVEFGYLSVADFNDKILKQVTASKNRQVLEKLHQEILEKLVEDNQFDVPDALLSKQEEYVKEDLSRTLKNQGFNDLMVKEYFRKWSADVTKKAVFQLRSGLILNTLAKDLKIEATEEDFDKKLAESAETSGMTVEAIKSYYSTNKQIKENIMYAIREEKTFEALKSQMKIK